MKKIVATRWRNGVPVEDVNLGFTSIRAAKAYAQARPVFGCTWTVSVYEIKKTDFFLPREYKLIQVPEIVTTGQPAPATLYLLSLLGA